MKWSLLLLCICPALHSSAQEMEGAVFDKDSKEPLTELKVINKRTGHMVYPSAGATFSIDAQAGDTILFYRQSYHPAFVIMPFGGGKVYRTVLMERLSYNLKEASVSSNGQYVQDSIAMRETFQHALDYNKPVKPDIRFAGGIAVRGLISALAERLLGQTKKKKKFRSTFFNEEQDRFVATRYTPELVTALTGLTGDSAAHFMNANIMPYDFARSAGDLELKMWIRYNYKQWINKVKDSTAHVQQ